MSSKRGRIINIQNFSIHDGPGIRTTVFFKGCPLRCAWCANPDSQRKGQELVHTAARCTDCRGCVAACPEGCIDAGPDGIAIDRARCTLCGDCIAACPATAMRMAARDLSLNEVLEEIEKEKHFYRNSGGGVTLSGGEPLAQPDFAVAILRRCRMWGIHTAIETSGHAPYQALEQVAGQADLIYFDLKHMEEEAHRAHTGVPNGRILENLKRISGSHPNIIVRVPLVPGINDAPEHLDAIGEFLIRDTTVRQLEFLNYHNLGEHKYAGIGKEYPLEITPLSREVFQGLCEEFSRKYPALQVSFHV